MYSALHYSSLNGGIHVNVLFGSHRKLMIRKDPQQKTSLFDRMENPDKPIKITVVGDGSVGKTFMLCRYVNNTLPIDYEPTIFDNYSTEICRDGKSYGVHLFDTSGQEDYDRIRVLSYTDRDCFLFCFAVNSKTAFDNIRAKWVSDVRAVNKEAKIVLVGTKSDLRVSGEAEVTETDGVKLMRRIRAKCYVECSALTTNGIDYVFSEAVRVVLRSRDKKRKRKCEII